MKKSLATALAVGIGLVASGAHAVVVDPTTELPDPITDAAALADPIVVSGLVRTDHTGNNFDGISPSAMSPYAGTPFENSAVYHSVSAGAEAKYLFGQPQSAFSLVYGSPDAHNTLSFFLDGVGVFDLVGNGLVPPGTLGLGAVYVTIGDFLFDEVRFTSMQDAFEFTNVSSVPSNLGMIPLPATLPLLFGALAGLGTVTRRRV